MKNNNFTLWLLLLVFSWLSKPHRGLLSTCILLFLFTPKRASLQSFGQNKSRQTIHSFTVDVFALERRADDERTLDEEEPWRQQTLAQAPPLQETPRDVTRSASWRHEPSQSNTRCKVQTLFVCLLKCNPHILWFVIILFY